MSGVYGLSSKRSFLALIVSGARSWRSGVPVAGEVDEFDHSTWFLTYDIAATLFDQVLVYTSNSDSFRGCVESR